MIEAKETLKRQSFSMDDSRHVLQRGQTERWF